MREMSTLNLNLNAKSVGSMPIRNQIIYFIKYLKVVQCFPAMKYDSKAIEIGS